MSEAKLRKRGREGKIKGGFGRKKDEEGKGLEKGKRK